MLEAAGFRVSKMVTVRVAENVILITLDNPGSDPKVDAEYARIRNYRQNMQDVYDKMLFGRPVRELLEYAHAKMQEEEQLTKVAEPE